MPKKWKKDKNLTLHLYKSSDQQQRNQRINEIHQRINENEADLQGDQEPAQLGNNAAGFPAILNGVDQNSAENPSEPSKDPGSTNVGDAAAAVKSDLDVGQVSATAESASTSTTMSRKEPHSKHNLLNPNPENPSEQKITSTPPNANADEQPEEDPSSNAAATVNNDWSPLDDNIEVDAQISSLANGSATKKKRLPVCEAICKGNE